jgi:hypothetical protein
MAHQPSRRDSGCCSSPQSISVLSQPVSKTLLADRSCMRLLQVVATGLNDCHLRCRASPLRRRRAACRSSELPRIRTTLPAACSKVGRPKAQGHTKAKAGECDESASSARGMSPPPQVDPEAGKRRCSWITANSGERYSAFLYRFSSRCVFFLVLLFFLSSLFCLQAGLA